MVVSKTFVISNILQLNTVPYYITVFTNILKDEGHVNSEQCLMTKTNIMTVRPETAQADLSLRWVHRSFCWFCHWRSIVFVMIRESYHWKRSLALSRTDLNPV